MSTNNQNKIKLEDLLKPIQELLDRLGEDSLNSSHTSLLISFEQMLTYTHNISRSGMPPDIELLLDTYHDMAAKFYTQCEATLLEEIWKQRTSQVEADTVLVLLDKMRLHPDFANREKEVVDAMETASKLLTASGESSKSEYDKLIEEFPTLMQKALDKLRDEWQRLNTIAVASKTINRNEKLIQALDAVVEAARFSVGTKVNRISVVPGSAFALQFYSYLKGFAVLTVPIYSVQAPWEWSIFWHELAGDKVRRLEVDTAVEISAVRDALKFFYEKYHADEEKRTAVLKFIARNHQYPDTEERFVSWTNNFSENYLRNLLLKEQLDLQDLGGFEYQFERMFENLPQKDRFKQYEEIKSDGWCVDWFKELFEDAWSLLAIREPFMHFFKDVLDRHVATDGRHPPLQVRLDVAVEILRLMQSDEQKVKRARTVIESAAQQILRFISLLIVSPMERAFEISQAVDQENYYWQAMRPQFSDVMGNEIGNYILKWSKGLTANIPFEEIKLYAQTFIEELWNEREFIEFLSTSNEQRLKEITESYTDLLWDLDQQKPKKYDTLLKLAFYDIDFDVVGIHTIHVNENSFMYSGILPKAVPGTVRYRVDNETTERTTDALTWNTTPGLGTMVKFPTTM